MSVGSERVDVYEGASGRARSFLCRRVEDSCRHWVNGPREGCWRCLGHIRSRVLQVDMAWRYCLGMRNWAVESSGDLEGV
jgi:hypothetical protein